MYNLRRSLCKAGFFLPSCSGSWSIGILFYARQGNSETSWGILKLTKMNQTSTMNQTWPEYSWLQVTASVDCNFWVFTWLGRFSGDSKRGFSFRCPGADVWTPGQRRSHDLSFVRSWQVTISKMIKRINKLCCWIILCLSWSMLYNSLGPLMSLSSLVVTSVFWYLPRCVWRSGWTNLYAWPFAPWTIRIFWWRRRVCCWKITINGHFSRKIIYDDVWNCQCLTAMENYLCVDDLLMKHCHFPWRC